MTGAGNRGQPVRSSQSIMGSREPVRSSLYISGDGGAVGRRTATPPTRHSGPRAGIQNARPPTSHPSPQHLTPSFRPPSRNPERLSTNTVPLSPAPHPSFRPPSRNPERPSTNIAPLPPAPHPVIPAPEPESRMPVHQHRTPLPSASPRHLRPGINAHAGLLHLRLPGFRLPPE